MRHLCVMGGVKGFGAVQHFLLQTETSHGDSRAQLTDLWKELEKYIGNCGLKDTIFCKFIFKKTRRNKKKRVANRRHSSLDLSALPPAPTFDSETGESIPEENLEIHPESLEHSIYLRQNLRIGKSNCLTFFDSGANTHLIDETLAGKEKLQRISDNHAALGVIGGRTITAESGNFRFKLGSRKEGTYHEIRAIGIDNVTTEFGEYGLEELGKEFMSSATELEKEYMLLKTVGDLEFIAYWEKKIQESNLF